jgi:5-carboxymethyl-2-hydroxymuconic-semialdehyde dehydrogenase
MSSSEAAPLDQPTPRRFELQRHYVDGEFRESAGTEIFTTVDPATNEELAEVAFGQPRDVDVAVGAARRAFDEGTWARLKATERADVLVQIGDLVRAHADAFVEREVYDIGMPITQMRGLAARAAQNFDYYAGVVRELAGRSFQVGGEFLNYTIRKPIGVAALIMPWNAPLMLSTWRLAPALAAGNTVVLKPAEWSPLSATLLAEVLDESDIPPGVFNVVQGAGETTGAALSSHDGIDLISFTGETTTGQKIVGHRSSSAASLPSSSSPMQIAISQSTPRSPRSSR